MRRKKKKKKEKNRRTDISVSIYCRENER